MTATIFVRPNSPAAWAAAITSAILVQKCAQIVDPHVGYRVAAYCFVEGAKTVPQKLSPENEGNRHQ